MKSILLKLAGGLAGLCACGLLAQGAPLQRADIVAAPAWLLHLDFDRLRTMTVFVFFLCFFLFS